MRFLELSGGPSAAFAGLLLAELGAEVIKVEPPTGGAFGAHPTAVLDSDALSYLDRRKRSVTLDIRKRDGALLMLRLIQEADALVEDLGVGGLGRLRLSYRRLRGVKPSVVVASIAPFGQTGPRAGWQASELVIQAMGGIVQSTGWDGEPPLKLAGFPAHFVAGIHAATAVLAAVYGVAAGNEGGVHIDISAQEAFLHHWSRHIGQWTYNGTGSRREQRVVGRQGFPHTVMAADGWLYILALRAEWEELAFFLGLERFISHEWSEPRIRAERWPEIEPHFYESIASRSKYDWFTGAAERGYTFAPIENALELLDSPQFAARGFLRPAQIGGRTVPCPGLPFNWDAPAGAANRPPSRGEHNEEVFRDLLGLRERELQRMRAKGVI